MKPNNRDGRQQPREKNQHSLRERSAARTDSGKLWISPDLNRTVSGPGGNRGEHTTSSAALLKLAEIALRK